MEKHNKKSRARARNSILGKVERKREQQLETDVEWILATLINAGLVEVSRNERGELMYRGKEGLAEVGLNERGELMCRGVKVPRVVPRG